MSSVYAPINPRVFAWARESAGYTVETAAKKIGRPPEDIVLWEADEKKPTLPQAKKAADVFHRPLAFFFLPEPPEEKILPDFRTFPDSKAEREEPKLRYFARRMVRRCEWAAEFRRTQGESPRAFVGAANLTDDPMELAEKIRRQLRIQPGALHEAGDKKAALQLLANNIRDAGVFVFSTDYISGRDVDIKDMRGLAVAEPLAPAVAYNSADYGAARKFSRLCTKWSTCGWGAKEFPPNRRRSGNRRRTREWSAFAIKWRENFDSKEVDFGQLVSAKRRRRRIHQQERGAYCANFVRQRRRRRPSGNGLRLDSAGCLQSAAYKICQEAIENRQRAKEARKMQGFFRHSARQSAAGAKRARFCGLGLVRLLQRGSASPFRRRIAGNETP